MNTWKEIIEHLFNLWCLSLKKKKKKKKKKLKYKNLSKYDTSEMQMYKELNWKLINKLLLQ